MLNFLNVNISGPNKIPKGANIPSHFRCYKSTTVVNASNNACVQDLVSNILMLTLNFHIQLKILKVLEIYLHTSSVTNLLVYSTVYAIICKCEIRFSYAVTTTPHHSWRYMAPACFVVPQLFSLVTHCCWFCSLTLSLHAWETWSRKALLPPPWGLYTTNDLHYQQGMRVSQISTGGVAMAMLCTTLADLEMP